MGRPGDDPPVGADGRLADAAARRRVVQDVRARGGRRLARDGRLAGRCPVLRATRKWTASDPPREGCHRSSRRSLPEKTFRQESGTLTTWSLQSQHPWNRFGHSGTGPPFCPKGPSRRGSPCRLMGRCTPDRSKLFGLHGKRPWLHGVIEPHEVGSWRDGSLYPIRPTSRSL